jgi:hypothetical protein
MKNSANTPWRIDPDTTCPDRIAGKDIEPAADARIRKPAMRQPVPTSEQFNTGAAAELKPIIYKALAKDVAERYPTIDPLASDLKSLKSLLEFQAELKRSRGDLHRTDNVRERRRDALTEKIPAAPDTNSGLAQLRTEEPILYPTGSKSTKRAVVLASVIALVIVAVIGAYVWKTGSLETRTPAQPNPPAAPNTAAAGPSRSLIYSLTVQSYTDGRYKNPFTLSGEMLFRNRDRVRLNIKSPQTGFLYILNKGPENVGGESYYNILFPSPTTNDGSAFLAADQEIQIPQQSWFELDAKEGTEIVWLVWSKDKLPELESAKQFANAEDKGRIKDPELNNAIASFLRDQQSNKATVERDDEKKESRIMGNADIVTHTVKLEHH